MGQARAWRNQRGEFELVLLLLMSLCLQLLYYQQTKVLSQRLQADFYLLWQQEKKGQWKAEEFNILGAQQKSLPPRLDYGGYGPNDKEAFVPCLLQTFADITVPGLDYPCDLP